MFYEIADACVEHLGALPSQLDLTHPQVIELLTYHRIQQRSQYVCPNCVEDDRRRIRPCFVCGNEFSEEHGVSSRRERGNEMVDPVVAGIVAEQARKNWKNATEEQKQASMRKFEEVYAGKIITPEQEAKAVASLQKSQEEARDFHGRG